MKLHVINEKMGQIMFYKTFQQDMLEMTQLDLTKPYQIVHKKHQFIKLNNVVLQLG